MTHQLKLSIFSLLFMCTSKLCAGVMGGELPLQSAYGYLGADIGIMGLNDKESSLLPSPSRHRLGTTGINGGGFIGYAIPINDPFIVSIEGFGHAISAQADATQNYGLQPQYQISMSYDAGIRLLPSYLITPSTLGYLILGYSYGQFHVQDNGNYGYVNDSFSENGFQAGLGLKTEILPPLSLRFDLAYTYYGSQTTYGRTLTGFQAYQNNLATIEANLALVYSFSI
jgi:opacity protein-like surface antigen